MSIKSISVVREKYLELMQAFLTGAIYRDPSDAVFKKSTFKAEFKPKYHHFDSYVRENGLDVPKNALTMIGLKRMANIRELAEQVIINDIFFEIKIK
jgi:hypothetical protein